MDLERFVTAQDSGGTYRRAVAELRKGRKASHWMWFIFPQIAGLGHSAMAQAYAISNLAEAQAYLAHPVLGPRLVECAEILASHRGLSAEQIFGGIDAIKLRSSMTFLHAPIPIKRSSGRSLTSISRVRTPRRTGASDSSSWLAVYGLPGQ